MHAACVQFDHAFFIREASETDAGIVRIVLRTFDHSDRGIECVPTALEEGEAIVKIVEAVVGADHDRLFATLLALRGVRSLR